MSKLMINNKLTKNIFYAFVAIMVVFLLFFVIAKTNTKDLFYDVELKTFDFRQNIIANHKKASKDIVIISIDDASLEYMQEGWPFPRKFYADLVDYLELQNPKSIAFDLMFVKSLKSNKSDDRKLAKVFKKYDNVFTSLNFDDEPKELRKPADLPEYLQISILNNSKINLQKDIINFSNFRPILPKIIENTHNIGHINITRDNDGIIREVPLFINYKDNLYPHVALKVALHYLGMQNAQPSIDKQKNLIFGNKKIPLRYDGQSILNWYGESGRNKNAKTFTYIPLYRVVKNMENNLPDKTFENKIVYVGTSATSMYDIKSVPTERNFPGVELHATLINNILDNNFIKKSPLKTDILICILIAVLTAYIVITLGSIFFASLLTIFVGAFYVYLSIFVMLHFNLWIGMIMPLLSLVLSYTVTYIIKYILKSRDFEYTYKLATTDGLTNLYNHRFFQEQMLINIENSKRYEMPFSLILIDIDFFKKFNDTYGHQAGDAVLRQVADTLKKTVRSTDIVCRYGGEEMSIILTNTNNEDAFQTAKKVCEAVANREFKLSNTLSRQVTISLGVATFPENGQTPTELIEFADKGLYKAKENGRNQVGR